MKTLDQVKPLANDLSEPSHTPGPWKISNGGGLVPVPLIVAERRNPAYPVKSGCALLSRNIATMTIHGPADENAANAKLIAAAPELLAALEDLIFATAKVNTPLANAARQSALSIVTKAKGEL